MSGEEKPKSIQDIEDQGRQLLLKAGQMYAARLKQTTNPRDQGRLSARIFAVERCLSSSFPWMSQAGQDRWIDQNITKGKRGCTFVEVGGYDGITGSNGWFFEKVRGWSGLIIEPSPHWAAICRSNRSGPCIQAAAGGTSRTARFLDVTEGPSQMSGLTGNYDEEMMTTVRDAPNFKGNEIDVQVRPLADMMAEVGLTGADYVSLDVEGAEAEVLGAYPFDEMPVQVWSVENRDMDPEIEEIMARAGYVRATRIGVDDIWAKPKT